MVTKYNQYNFHKYTFCVFQEVILDEVADLPLHYISKSGSSYFVTKDGVYRKSNHWGRVANCRWRLKTLNNDQISKYKVGFSSWSNFYKDNETESLYFIQIESLEKLEIYLQHKEHCSYKQENLLRTGKESAKRIKRIKEIATSNQWAKYLDLEDIESARIKIIEYLVTTNLSFQEIKRREL